MSKVQLNKCERWQRLEIGLGLGLGLRSGMRLGVRLGEGEKKGQRQRHLIGQYQCERVCVGVSESVSARRSEDRAVNKVWQPL